VPSGSRHAPPQKVETTVGYKWGTDIKGGGIAAARGGEKKKAGSRKAEKVKWKKELTALQRNRADVKAGKGRRGEPQSPSRLKGERKKGAP